jgi:hypothetical protein
MRKLITAFIVLLLLLCVGLSIFALYLPSRAARFYGPPSSSLSLAQRV